MFWLRKDLIIHLIPSAQPWAGTRHPLDMHHPFVVSIRGAVQHTAGKLALLGEYPPHSEVLVQEKPVSMQGAWFQLLKIHPIHRQ